MKVYSYWVICLTVVRLLNLPKQTYEISSNRELQVLFGKPSTVVEIRLKRLSWLGRVLRAGSITNWIPFGRRPIGRPKLRRFDKSKRELSQLGLDNINELALGRDGVESILFLSHGP